MDGAADERNKLTSQADEWKAPASTGDSRGTEWAWSSFFVTDILSEVNIA